MTDRLTALDVSFLYLEGRTTPMHAGSLSIFERPADGFDYERLVHLIEQRISLVPRYRQKVVWVPGHLANPVWVDDPDFDITYHVRRSGLPRPGTDAQLREFCARIQSRPLDRSRPLWEMYLIEGLAGGRIAIASKTHCAMVDGLSAVDIAQVILDGDPRQSELPGALWMPPPSPTPVQLVLDAVSEVVSQPTAVFDVVRMGISDVRMTAGRAVSALGGLLSTVHAVASPPGPSSLNASIGEQRRFAVARTSLADYREVRRRHDVTVNDVVLATIAGALRGWMLFRGEAVTTSTSLRAMVPVSVRSIADPRSDGLALVPGSGAAQGDGVTALFVDLPVGEPNPILRLSRVAFATRAHKESGQSVSADALVALGGFAAPTLHAMGARLAGSLAHRVYNLVVTNVPGPQVPVYAAGAKMLEAFPIVPLAAGQAVAIGLTSYDGGVYFGVNADRDAMPDVDVLASLIEESLAELVAASAASAARRPIAAVAELRSRNGSANGRRTNGNRPSGRRRTPNS